MTAASVDLPLIGLGSHMDWLLWFHPHPDKGPCLLLGERTRTAMVSADSKQYYAPSAMLQESEVKNVGNYAPWRIDRL